MRQLTLGVLIVVVTGAIGPAAVSRGAAQGAATPPLVTEAEYVRWQKELSNWGRWGKDDERGALNLITPAKRREAAGLVREGLTVSLAVDTPTKKSAESSCPSEWTMTKVAEDGSGDGIAFPCIHGGSGMTHLDALAHRFNAGRMWNGHPASLVTVEKGATKSSVLTTKAGIVTRAVLFDMPRLKGVPYLEPGTRIFPADLEAWERKVGVRIDAGDALLLRWGRDARAAAGKAGEGSAGFDVSVIPWLKRRDVAVIGWESGWYAPQPPGDLTRLAVHDFAVTFLGIYLIDRINLEPLSAAAATHNRWDFMLTVAPLPIPNGTGSPVNPIAMF